MVQVGTSVGNGGGTVIPSSPAGDVNEKESSDARLYIAFGLRIYYEVDPGKQYDTNSNGSLVNLNETK